MAFSSLSVSVLVESFWETSFYQDSYCDEDFSSLMGCEGGHTTVIKLTKCNNNNNNRNDAANDDTKEKPNSQISKSSVEDKSFENTRKMSMGQLVFCGYTALKETGRVSKTMLEDALTHRSCRGLQMSFARWICAMHPIERNVYVDGLVDGGLNKILWGCKVSVEQREKGFYQRLAFYTHQYILMPQISFVSSSSSSSSSNSSSSSLTCSSASSSPSSSSSSSSLETDSHSVAYDGKANDRTSYSESYTDQQSFHQANVRSAGTINLNAEPPPPPPPNPKDVPYDPTVVVDFSKFSEPFTIKYNGDNMLLRNNDPRTGTKSVHAEILITNNGQETIDFILTSEGSSYDGAVSEITEEFIAEADQDIIDAIFAALSNVTAQQSLLEQSSAHLRRGGQPLEKVDTEKKTAAMTEVAMADLSGLKETNITDIILQHKETNITEFMFKHKENIPHVDTDVWREKLGSRQASICLAIKRRMKTREQRARAIDVLAQTDVLLNGAASQFIKRRGHVFMPGSRAASLDVLPGATRASVKEALQFVRQTFGDELEGIQICPEASLFPTNVDSPPGDTVYTQGTQHSQPDSSKDGSTLSSHGGTTSSTSFAEPSDPLLPLYQYGMYAIRAVDSWRITKGDKRVVIGVIDSGIVTDNVDLRDNLFTDKQEIPANHIDDDINGFSDDIQGYNFLDNSDQIADDNGHGTHCAAVTSAKINGIDVVGVSPDSTVLAIKFTDSKGVGSMAGAMYSIDYCRLQGCQVSSNSYGGNVAYSGLTEAIERARVARLMRGSLVVAAAGNSNANNDLKPIHPCNTKGSNVICVASVDANNNLSSFSNYGQTSVHLAAPGSHIMSQGLRGTVMMSGTSMATPHVAGVAAQIYAAFLQQGYDPHYMEVKEIIRLTGVPLKSLQTTTIWGIIPDVHAAVLMTQLGGLWLRLDCRYRSVSLSPGMSGILPVKLIGALEGTFTMKLRVTASKHQGTVPLGSQAVYIKILSSRTATTDKDRLFDKDPSIVLEEVGRNPEQVQLCSAQTAFQSSIESVDPATTSSVKAGTGVIIAVSVVLIFVLVVVLYKKYNRFV
eukprot:GHVQ01000982.1.p1 GENE.GHVQ01000982.1~~GHVQ01000982.1.p1  ORF type:complete len:1069 (+),score=179.14 GHVQ01000982.1:304-3510(+)